MGRGLMRRTFTVRLDPASEPVAIEVDDRRPADPGYWLHRPGKVALDWPATDPAPVVVNTDPRPEGAPVDPPAVLKLQRAAQAAGWPIRTGYSRGLLRTRSVGVYKDVEIIGVWAGEHDGTRWYAMYERTIGAKTGWKWGAITLWKRGQPMVSGLTITQLTERLFKA